MKHTMRWGTAFAAGLALLVLAAGRADAKPAYATAEKKPCSFCHIGKTSDKVFTEAGTQYAAHHTLKGFGETAKAPGPGSQAATAPAPASEPPPAAETASGEKMSPPGCGCAHGMGKPCGSRDAMHGGGMAPHGMESMQRYIEEMRKTVSGLRESEKKLEASAGTDPFRAAVLDHLKKLDDLTASHLEQMERMMGPVLPAKEEAPPGHGK
jgi:hypothetical protein